MIVKLSATSGSSRLRLSVGSLGCQEARIVTDFAEAICACSRVSRERGSPARNSIEAPPQLGVSLGGIGVTTRTEKGLDRLPFIKFKRFSLPSVQFKITNWDRLTPIPVRVRRLPSHVPNRLSEPSTKTALIQPANKSMAPKPRKAICLPPAVIAGVCSPCA